MGNDFVRPESPYESRGAKKIVVEDVLRGVIIVKKKIPAAVLWKTP